MCDIAENMSRPPEILPPSRVKARMVAAGDRYENMIKLLPVTARPLYLLGLLVQVAPF